MTNADETSLASRGRLWRLAMALLAVVGASGPRQGPSPQPSSFEDKGAPAAVGPASLQAPFDLPGIVRRAHFSFRQEGARYTGGHATYAVVAEAGRLSVSPVQLRKGPRGTRLVGAPLVLETSSIARGLRHVGPSRFPALDEEGRLVRSGDLVTETVRNGSDGVEVSWTFPAKPEGEGGLVVRVATSGLQYTGVTDGGLHFHDRESGLGLRYGHATWIGAGGARTSIPARWDGHEIVIEVPARVIDETSYPAVLDPLIGPETTVDSPVSGPATGNQYGYSTAYSGAGYLVVWTDFRNPLVPAVLGTRVSLEGAVLDPDGISISPPATESDWASAVWDGTHFLVVFGGGGDIFGRRLDTGGALVDASPFAISNHADAQYQPFAVSDGSTTFVVWSDDRNASTSGTDVYGARVSGSTVMDAAGIAISTAAGEQSYPRVTHGGGNWFIVWTDFRSGTHQDIYGARVAQSTGTLLDGVTTGLAVSAPTSNQYGPWPASNGTDYFVVWTDDRNQFTTGIDVYGARVTSAGVILDATGIQICNDDSEQSSPSIAYNGGNYLVVWTDGRSTGLYGNRVNGVTGALVDGAAGVRIDASTIDLMVSLPRIHVAGADFYVVWSELQGENLAYVNILGSRLTSALSLQDAPGVSLASSANSQTEVAVASNGADYFVVWVDDRGLGKAIYGARVNGTTGASLDPAAILLSNGGLGEASPALAFNGTHYLVVWRDSRFPAGIWGTRVDPATGAVIDPSGLNLFPTPANQPYSPQLASDGASWFVVWQDTRNAGSSDIYGGLVTGAGTPLNPAGILISNAASSQFRPRVAFGDGYYLVVWADMRAGGNMDLYGARVSASGTVVEPTATNLPIATGPGFVTAGGYDVAHASPRFVVAYEEAGIVRRARVASATGAVVDDLALTACCAHFPSIAYDQDTFVVAYNIPPAGGLGYDLKGTRVTAAGVDIDATDWDIVTGGGLMLPDHRVAALGPLGKALVAYSRYDSTPGITSQRARTRLLTRIPRADLAVTKTDGVTTAVRGLGLTYSMVVSNVGPDDVTGATVADVIPSSLVCSTTCAGTGAATCAAGPFAGSINDAVDIPSGQSVTYTSVCTVSPSASGSISNTVTVAVPAGTEDANPANNSATDTDVVAQMADLSVTKTDGVTTLMPGQLVNYTITVSNLGPDAVTGAHVVDAAPFELQGVSWTCSGSPGSSCTAVGSVSISDLADIPAGGAVTYTLTATVDWALGGGPLANSASVTPPAGAFDPNPANDSATDTDTIVAPSLSVGDVTVAEGNAGATIAHFTVTLSPASPVQVSVSYTTQGVTALAGSDFVAAAGTLTFDAGETSKPIDVTVNGDTQFEPNETFAVNLSGASAAVIGDGTGVGTIANDDTPAGPSRVFVSVLGLDTNDCSNIATPCRTLNAAMAQVAVDGEVIVIKSGSYAGGAITKGVKIDVASGVVAFSGQPISIDAGSGRVVLRGLTLKAVTPGLGTGILVQSAAAVFVENSVVDGWDIGIHQAGVPQGGGSEVFVTDTTIRNNNTGLYAAAGGTAILDTRVSNNGIGLAADYATLSVRGATLSGNVTGIDAHNKSSVTVEKSQIAHNGIGITLPASSLSTVRLSRSVVSGNTIGLENVDGTLEVSGNNVIRGNTTNTSGMITPGGLQ